MKNVKKVIYSKCPVYNNSVSLKYSLANRSSYVCSPGSPFKMKNKTVNKTLEGELQLEEDMMARLFL